MYFHVPGRRELTQDAYPCKRDEVFPGRGRFVPRILPENTADKNCFKLYFIAFYCTQTLAIQSF